MNWASAYQKWLENLCTGDLWPVEYGSHSGAVCAVPVHVEPSGQQNAVFYGNGAVREWRDEQLVPAWRKKRIQPNDIKQMKSKVKSAQEVHISAHNHPQTFTFAA